MKGYFKAYNLYDFEELANYLHQQHFIEETNYKCIKWQNPIKHNLENYYYVAVEKVCLKAIEKTHGIKIKKTGDIFLNCEYVKSKELPEDYFPEIQKQKL